MAKWINTKFPGIRYRQHPTRKFGVRRDRYYSIRFYLDGRRIEESLGWESNWKQSHPAGSISLEQEAATRRAVLMQNAKEGTGPRTLKESRTENEVKRKKDAAKIKADLAATRTLREYWDETYYPAAERSKKQSSVAKEEQHFRRWIGPLLGGLTLRSIGIKQWDELVKTLSAGGLSARSKEYITGTLRRVLKHAYERRMTDEGPPTGRRIGVSGPGNNRRMRVISHDEESQIMQRLAEVDMNAWAAARFAFLTGCRASEAFSLKWAGVDFSQGTVTFTETKNKDPRAVPITGSLRELFEAVGQGGPNELVFPQAKGRPYLQAPTAFSEVVEELKLNNGRMRRDRLTWHSIRHTVATRLAQRLGLRDLMDIMGWRTVIMAMRYVHGNEDAKMKAMEMLGTAPVAGKVLPFRGETLQGESNAQER